MLIGRIASRVESGEVKWRKKLCRMRLRRIEKMSEDEREGRRKRGREGREGKKKEKEIRKREGEKTDQEK